MTFQHRAGVSPYTSSYDFAETCVFGKQSLGPFHCGPLELKSAKDSHSTGASLLPKLRDHFAEFLNEGSSDRLSILYLPTCVGFGTGTPHLPRRFSRRHVLSAPPAFVLSQDQTLREETLRLCPKAEASLIRSSSKGKEDGFISPRRLTPTRSLDVSRC